MQLILILAIFAPSYGITNFADIKCGESPVKVNPKIKAPRISGGTEAFQGEFPWIVSLQYASGGNYPSHFCAGFLVNSRYVLTAAHCLQSIVTERFNVVVGEHNIGVEETPLNAYAVEIEKIVMHADFSGQDTTRNDIALLRLKTAVNWTSYAQPACLPGGNDPIPVGQIASIAGWGYTKGVPECQFNSIVQPNDIESRISNTLTHRKDTLDISKLLLTVDIPLVSTAKCEEDYEWTATERQLCAGSPTSEKGGCKGDSGSPLMAKEGNDESVSVIGIHAGGHGCGTGMGYGIYTRVASYVDWIKFNIRP